MQILRLDLRVNAPTSSIEPLLPPPGRHFPLKDRLTPIELVLLYSFREGLPEHK